MTHNAESEAVKHALVSDTLYIERGGIIGKCVCGWNTGHRITSAIAFNAFQDHLEARAALNTGGGE